MIQRTKKTVGGGNSRPDGLFVRLRSDSTGTGGVATLRWSCVEPLQQHRR
jgi:hypothetical protein